ncbi:MAG: phosphatidylglycerophosphatase A [Synergistaceae bacterium]|jgi:phosphatidylglycerophosphatase A|nr:phosphatidylglycerophosphatase A [Synergistaceae bacterium]
MKIIKSWYELVSTLFWLGRLGKMPGTLGSAAALLILLALRGVHPLALLAVIAVGGVASDLYARERGQTDPQDVIIDEVAGYWVSMVFIEATLLNALVAFCLFRVIDIVKPFPVDALEKLPGGVGIMADDICGGIIVNLFVRAISWFLFAGGLGAVGAYFGVSA